MRAIMVSVNYADLLAITLPYNRHHFQRILVVTDCDPKGIVDVRRICDPLGVDVFCTGAFYRDGAKFNKWLALEEGLDALGREGWICIMDADVLWPKSLRVKEWTGGTDGSLSGPGTLELVNLAASSTKELMVLTPGQLCTPMRRMWDEWPECPPLHKQIQWRFTTAGYRHDGTERQFPIPEERSWDKFPLHRQQREFAGYSQIFHASDLVLGPAPWHQTDWTHAGGADSFFQAKWPDERKVRPPFEVLHLGSAGQNWFGRATPLADGTVLPGSAERLDYSGRRIWEQRRRNRAEGRDQFDGERIK